MTDTNTPTYTLYANNEDQDAIHWNIKYYRVADYYGAIAVYEAGSNSNEPDAVYAPGQWSCLTKDQS